MAMTTNQMMTEGKNLIERAYRNEKIEFAEKCIIELVTKKDLQEFFYEDFDRITEWVENYANQLESEW